MSGGNNGLLGTGLGIAASIAAPELAPAFLTDSLGTAGASALTGSLLGGGISALTGGNVLQGAVGGGLGGYGSGGGFSGLMGSGTNATPSLSSAGATTQPFDYQSYANATGDTGGAAQAFNPNAVPTTQPGSGGALSNYWNNLTDTSGSGLNAAQKMTLGAAGVGGLGYMLYNQGNKYGVPTTAANTGPLSHYQFNPYTYVPNNRAPSFAEGGAVATGTPGTVEQMSNQNATGNNLDFPQSNLSALTGHNQFTNATNTPTPNNVLGSVGDAAVDPYTGEAKLAGGGIVAFDQGGQAQYDPYAELQQQYMLKALTGMPSTPPTASAKGGSIHSKQGLGSLGGYSDGGQLLKGPGDGMSDNIPATIADKQPARLADNEFVVPADVVSHLGNGSSDAGAKKLYKMMDNVRQARTGTKKQGKQINADKYLPS